MPNAKTPVVSMIAAATMAVAIAWTVTQINSLPMPNQATAVGRTPSAKPTWTASAPGRVEPRGGEIKIGSQAAGRIAEVAVKMNDRVRTGDLLIRLDDEDARARVSAADAEAAVRRRERDAETVSRLAQDRRNAEDAVAAAERALTQSRADLDRALRASRDGTPNDSNSVSAARAAVASAQEKLEQERAGLRRAQTASGVPLPTRLEAALTAARSELSLAEAALERTRIRAPSDGTVLQVNARVGETATPSAEQTLVVMGDVSALRVRAEIEERDTAKVRVGQAAIVRSDAHPGKDFEGKVATIAQALGPTKLAQRGPRRPNDVDVLEVVIDLDGTPPLLPGMRVDVFFRPDATVENDKAPKSN
ncbi:MAG TPA: efflux RND transporter periplasmic adaptor subunit [Hyphomicrobiaceae bacterium]|nr:efflux RND transporter periplasmic adaptor subunit [Hyphomicrobiaceae bacterium]